MQKFPTRIQGAWLIKPKVHADLRGFFLETWNRDKFRSIEADLEFIQDNHSRSSCSVLRGLHYQAGRAAQGKLVWVTSGKVFDVIVDLRRGSSTFGMWDGYTLTADKHERVWVPPGCAHGFLVLSETADFHYKVTAPYAPASERSLRWDDATVGIKWPLPSGVAPILSAKDAAAPCFEECEKYH